MQKQAVMINGHELVVGVQNRAFLKRLTDALAAAEAALAASAAKHLAAVDDPRALYIRLNENIQTVCDFFDQLYGEGTATRLFNGRKEVTAYEQALLAFNAGIDRAFKSARRRFR